MGVYDTSIGAPMLGVFLNTYMYGVVSAQYATYCIKKFHDPYWMRALVVSLFSMDTVNTVSLMYAAWVYLVQNYDNPEAVDHYVWPIPLTVLINTITVFLAQIFLAYRVLRLTSSKLAYFMILCLSVLGLVAGMTCVVTVWKYKVPSSAILARTAFEVWLCLTLAVNLLITTALIAVLSRSRTEFHISKTIVNRLIRGAIQSGFVMSIFSALVAILFFRFPLSRIYSVVGFPNPRFYSVTLMDTLIARHRLKEILEGSRADTSAIWELEDIRFPQPTDSSRSIQLHIRTQVYSNARAQEPASDCPSGMKSLPDTSDLEIHRISTEKPDLNIVTAV